MCNTANQPNMRSNIPAFSMTALFYSSVPRGNVYNVTCSPYKPMCHPEALGRNLGHPLLSHDQSVLVTLRLGHFPHG